MKTCSLAARLLSADNQGLDYNRQISQQLGRTPARVLQKIYDLNKQPALRFQLQEIESFPIHSNNMNEFLELLYPKSGDASTPYNLFTDKDDNDWIRIRSLDLAFLLDLSEDTINRALRNLRGDSLIHSEKLLKKFFSQTVFYRINPDAVMQDFGGQSNVK